MSKPLVGAWTVSAVDAHSSWGEHRQAVREITCRWAWILWSFAGLTQRERVVEVVVKSRLEWGGHQLLRSRMPPDFGWGEG